MGKFRVNLNKSVTQEGGGASSPGLAVERESVKSLLFPHMGQNGSVVWRKSVASLERENPLLIFFLLHINVLTVRCNISWRGIFTGGVGRGEDYRVWRWKKIRD